MTFIKVVSSIGRNVRFLSISNNSLWNYAKVSDTEKKTFVFSNFANHNRYISVSSFGNKKMKEPNIISSETNLHEISTFEDEEFQSLFNKSGNMAGISRIAVLQPWIKWGSKKRHTTSRDLLLDEACALVNSLPSISITYKEGVNLQNIGGNHIFTSGTLERLIAEVRRRGAQAVFVSIDFLTRSQRSALEEAFGMKVLDRYSVVLGIFKHYATTAESKIQIAMAELPFIRKGRPSEVEKMIIDRREALLKEALNRLAGRRENMRKTRQKANLPAVAIVGYTNCGKTTLIRALTGDKSIVGADRLFATLDVTAHKLQLPSGVSVILFDTVGFIQDIPTGLIASFRSTLMDTVFADVIVHLRDISHPDVPSQTTAVQDTLIEIEVPESTPVVTVNNKCDRVEEDFNDDHLNISALSGEGLNDLLQIIDAKVMQVTGRKKYKMRLLTGSDEIGWLRKHAGVSQMNVCEKDSQYTVLIAVMNEAELSAYIQIFRANR